MRRITYTEPTSTSCPSQVSALIPILGLILTMGVLFFTPHRIAAAQAIDIPDRNLRTILRSALHKEAGTDITQEDLASLERLDVFNSNIHDITGLEYAINLTQLHLGRNRIADVSPLENLTNLTYLDLHRNQKISDISPLKNLTKLIWLSLTRQSNIGCIRAQGFDKLDILAYWLQP